MRSCRYIHVYFNSQKSHVGSYMADAFMSILNHKSQNADFFTDHTKPIILKHKSDENIINMISIKISQMYCSISMIMTNN